MPIFFNLTWLEDLHVCHVHQDPILVKKNIKSDNNILVKGGEDRKF